MQRLLAKYSDVTLAKLPTNLPPLRGITHHIDLVLRFKIPNQATYRLSPHENEEMRRQVS